MDLLAQLLQTFADALFGSAGVGIDSPAEIIGSPLYAVGQICLIHATQSVAQLGGCLGLRRRQLPCGVTQVLLQLRQII